ncbi:hypothetical protein J3459_014767 [Metarhizium acridum]|uniref:uncharacterized protein n=1 Tax=Metarhizium acridum TaxID=92637 RepID=UPI001C6C9D2A|nr:hypothetical protein J3458_014417 [Metarhizium acridum]KAG8414380.1 hypothetical protein J3459_014767 [Metarhizium acridum]
MFNAAVGLIDNERFEGFQSLAKGLAKGISTLFGRNILVPDVVITDFDDQMKKTIGIEFPVTQQQLCIHHINSNLMLQSKRRWVYSTRDSGTGDESNSDEPDATLNPRDGQAVHASEGKRSQSHETSCISLCPTTTMECLCCGSWWLLLRQDRNIRRLGNASVGNLVTREQSSRIYMFGIRVISGTEAGDDVKSHLLNGMGHFYRLVEAFQGILADQEREFRQACARDEVLTARKHVGQGSECLGGLPYMVSRKAL